MIDLPIKAYTQFNVNKDFKKSLCKLSRLTWRSLILAQSAQLTQSTQFYVLKADFN